MERVCLMYTHFNPKKNMKKHVVLITTIAGLLLGLTTSALAADQNKPKGKEVTITGDGKCAKCALKETEKCQNVIQTTEDGKTVTYYLTRNDVSKDFHDNLCKETKKVTATGTVKEV